MNKYIYTYTYTHTSTPTYIYIRTLIYVHIYACGTRVYSISRLLVFFLNGWYCLDKFLAIFIVSLHLTYVHMFRICMYCVHTFIINIQVHNLYCLHTFMIDIHVYNLHLSCGYICYRYPCSEALNPLNARSNSTLVSCVCVCVAHRSVADTTCSSWHAATANSSMSSPDLPPNYLLRPLRRHK